MARTVLFDLDDTLLGNNMDTFIPRYFAMLSQFAAGLNLDIDLLRVLLLCTRTVIGNTDPDRTNREVFWDAFAEHTGLDTVQLEQDFGRFYVDHFPAMRSVVDIRPNARAIIQHCFDQGDQVVIATNPLFPRSAIEQRLDWAGVPVAEFPYALVTTYDNMHATKPNLAYYEEILRRVGASAESTIMIGDDWENDIQPAHALGLQTFWIADPAAPLPEALPVSGHGDLAAAGAHLGLS